jgi:GNAT superfamily N-acetyltransferase
MPELIDVTAADGRIAHPEWLARAEAVHRQLRDFREPYALVMARVFAGGGRMRVAVVDGGVRGVAVYRVHENTHPGLHMYVDDLVTDAASRSSGVGAALLSSLETTARERGCVALKGDSGTARQRAHAFYFRQGYAIIGFHFNKAFVDDIPPLKV